MMRVTLVCGVYSVYNICAHWRGRGARSADDAPCPLDVPRRAAFEVST